MSLKGFCKASNDWTCNMVDCPAYLLNLDAHLARAVVDIVFAHQPDPNVPMLEIVRAFSWLIDQGKVCLGKVVALRVRNIMSSCRHSIGGPADGAPWKSKRLTVSDTSPPLVQCFD